MVGSVVTPDDCDRFVLDIENYEDDLQTMLAVGTSLLVSYIAIIIIGL